MSDFDFTGDRDWQYIVQFLPVEWKEMTKKLGMMKFGRKFSGEDAESRLLRTLLVHIAGNKSLRATSAIAKQSGLADVSDVGILDRLKNSEQWFNWATKNLLSQFQHQVKMDEFRDYKIKLIDASLIEEPGATGSRWRLHMSFNYPDLTPDQIVIDTYRRGESLVNFKAAAGDLFIGDRAYGRRTSISHAVAGGADVLFRISPWHLPMHTASGGRFQLKTFLSKLNIGEIGETEVWIKTEGGMTKGRLCVIKKNDEDRENAEKKAKRKASKNGFQISEESIEHAGFVMIFTTLPSTVVEAFAVLELAPASRYLPNVI